MSFFGMYECIMQLLEYLVKSHMQIADKPYKKTRGSIRQT